MPRRPTRTMGEVPLSLIPSKVMSDIRNYGDNIEWIRMKRACHHFSLVRMHTRPVKRELHSKRNYNFPERNRPAAEGRGGA